MVFFVLFGEELQGTLRESVKSKKNLIAISEVICIHWCSELSNEVSWTTACNTYIFLQTASL